MTTITGTIAGIILFLFAIIAIALAVLIFLLSGSIAFAAAAGLIFFGIAWFLIAYFWLILILAVVGLLFLAYQNRDIIHDKLKGDMEDRKSEYRQQAEEERVEREERARRQKEAEVPASDLPHYRGGVVEETYEGEVIDAEEVSSGKH